LLTALGFAGLGSEAGTATEIQTLRRWLDSWPGIGAVVGGMAHQGYDIQLTRYVYEMRAPVRGWERANDGVMRVMWAVCGTVNAKNRFGGYVGQRPFLTMFHQARVVIGFIDHKPPKYTTSFVVGRCTAWYGPAGTR